MRYKVQRIPSRQKRQFKRAPAPCVEVQTIFLDVFYGDTWLAPTMPKAWQSLSFPRLKAKVYDYTRSTLYEFDGRNVDISMIQIGNEIDLGFMWPAGVVYEQGKEANFTNFAELLKAGIQAVRDSVCGKRTNRR